MRAGDTLRVRGEGGTEFDLDVPEDGTERRSIFDKHIASGFLTIVSDEVAVDEDTDKASNAATEETPTAPSAPAASAPKAEWVAYAATLGLDAAGMTKAAIVAAIDEVTQ